ncbi:MAG: DNA polymerase III subunit [Bacteroidales bacterium]|nr:DNA polymerase III subunit [Bacteroidales bacterium]
MQFKDIVGQGIVKNHLREMYDKQRLAHATLFLGPEGSGTLPLALAFAQYVNCTGDKSGGDSCGQCPSCRKFAKLIHPDLHFVYPVVRRDEHTDSDTYIDEWRALFCSEPYFDMEKWTEAMGGNKQALISRNDAAAIHRKLSMQPFEAQFQVLIMWHPELMNDTAANRILKILEEPPRNTLFMLVGENTSEILPTILSRTQIVNVPPVLEEDIAQYVSADYGVDQEQAGNIAHVSGGSVIKARQMMSELADDNDNLDFFIDLMRKCYMRNVADLLMIADVTAKLTREQVKSRLTYSIRMIRESFVMNLGHGELNYMTTAEEQFAKKFAPFIHIDNVMQLSDLMTEAIAQVEQNGNVRIIIADLVMQMTILLKKPRPTL